MKKISVILAFLIVALLMAACTTSETTEFPTGVFLEENSSDVINLKDNGTFTATSPEGVQYISGTYTVTHNKLTVTSSDEKTCEHSLPETYNWEFDGVSLTLRPIEEVCLLTVYALQLTLQE